MRVSNLRTVLRSSDRRGKPRLPVYLKAELLTLSTSGVVLDSMSVRVRNISESGIAVILPHDVGLSLTVLIGLRPTGYETHWMECRLRRMVQLDAVSRLAAASFERLLLPGQLLSVGGSTTSLSWLNVLGGASPDDPFEMTKARRKLELQRV